MPDSAQLVAQERLALKELMDSVEFGIPHREVDENILVATWNIQHFSDKKSDRALQYMADIVERFDIVAIQEAKTDLTGLSQLQGLLPGDYRILVTDPTGNSERLTFLYDRRTVVPTGLVCEIGFNVPGDTHTGFQLHRMPYCASFRAGRFDFAIVNVHIFQSDTSFRREEIEKLVEFIDGRVQQPAAKVFDRDFFVVGDFNIDQAGDQFFNALVSKGFKMPPGMDTLGTNFSRTKTFDKIAWVDRESFAFEDKFNVVPFGDVLFQDADPPGGKKEISDHLPLWAEFRVNKLSQELDQILNPPQ